MESSFFSLLIMTLIICVSLCVFYCYETRQIQDTINREIKSRVTEDQMRAYVKQLVSK